MAMMKLSCTERFLSITFIIDSTMSSNFHVQSANFYIQYFMYKISSTETFRYSTVFNVQLLLCIVQFTMHRNFNVQSNLQWLDSDLIPRLLENFEN